MMKQFVCRSDGTIPAKLTGPSSLEDHSSMEVNSKGSNRSTQKGNSGSKSAPTTPVRQHKYNMREMARNRRNRFSQSP